MHSSQLWPDAPANAWFALIGVAIGTTAVFAALAHLGIRALWLAVLAIAVAIVGFSPTVPLYNHYCGFNCGQGLYLEGPGLLTTLPVVAGLLSVGRRIPVRRRLVITSLVACGLLATTASVWIV